jgi:hypothetical protein
MKKLLPYYRLLPVFAILLVVSGCMKDKISRTYQIMTPVYADKAVVFANVKSGPSQQISRPGKIFIRGSYLFINEVDKGVHIFDNSNPSSPRAVSFIDIPGNLDVAVSGNYLYADMYSDMLTIDITDPLNTKLADTTLSVFPDRFYYNGWAADNSQVIVGWDIRDTTVSDNGISFGWNLGGCPTCAYYAVPAGGFQADRGPSSELAKGGTIPGIAGSMARFVVVNKYLYAVNQSSLLAFDITDESNPVRKKENFIGWQIETIYPFRENLFIGSSTGMFIYNIDQPESPEPKGSFNHFTACDPVVSDGDYAYVTLRSGTTCQGFTNQLDIIDVTDVMQPKHIRTYAMINPHGLGKDGELLFICDGTAGVKVYNASNVLNLQLVNQIENIDAYDAIPWADRLIVSAADGLYQYDYSDVNDIKLLSTIRIGSK